MLQFFIEHEKIWKVLFDQLIALTVLVFLLVLTTPLRRKSTRERCTNEGIVGSPIVIGDISEEQESSRHFGYSLLGNHSHSN